MEEIILPNVETVKEEKNYGIFVIQPLYPGYGYTIGNSLRRVLLSSLEGAAISSVKFEGAPHQFSTLEGVKEDITEIILNLKKVRLKIYEGNSATLELKVNGPKEVKAKDIKTPASVEIVNPDLYLASLDNEKGSLRIEMRAEKGRGYLPIEVRTEPQEVGVIQVDSLFSPVLLVNLRVETTRVGQRTDFNKLTLEIKTDGTITPREALKRAAEILSFQLEPIKNLGLKEEKRRTKTTRGEKIEETTTKKRSQKGASKKSR